MKNTTKFGVLMFLAGALGGVLVAKLDARYQLWIGFKTTIAKMWR